MSFKYFYAFVKVAFYDIVKLRKNKKEGMVINPAKAQKIFPVYMRNIKLPMEVTAEEVHVYRICKTGKVEADSFLTSYEEYQRSGNVDRLDLEDVGSYSVSCWEKERDARRQLTFFTKRNPKAIASLGITAEECGVIQRTKERKGRNAKSHIDWWIYENANPCTYFKEVSLNE